ncbi:MAG TPA: hypothetical protein DEQ03_01245, partial [Marinilabiliales bacterium]|nr:hypothetical protein [Marinilabiliales bacterium]
MDRNSWIGLALIVGVMFFWSYLTKPTPEETAERQKVQDSLIQVQKDRAQKQILLDQEMANNPSITNSGANSDSIVKSQLGDFSSF